MSNRVHSLPEAQIASTHDRIHFLDGVRGWASFSVLLSHILMNFLIFSMPLLRFDNTKLLAFVTEQGLSFNLFVKFILFGVVTSFISNGHLAVLIFFVLSGYALSIGQLNLSKRNLPLAFTSRYFRLMIPILVTSLFTYSLLKLNLMFNLAAAAESEKSMDWLGSFYKFDGNLKDAVTFSLYKVFFKYDGGLTYNSSLWTMPIEIIGSVLIYAYLGIFRNTEKVKWKLLIIAILSLFYFKPIYACFLIGYAIAEINRKNPVEPSTGIFKKRNKFETLFICIFMVCSLVSIFLRGNDQIECILAASIVLSVSYSYALKSFFSNRLSAYLGRISFPLYLVQIPIICSWSSYLYLKLPALGLSPMTSNFINLFSTISLCLVTATLLVPIEKLSVVYSKKIGLCFIK